MQWFRRYFLRLIITYLSLLPLNGIASDMREIETVTVQSESGLAIALSQLASAFSKDHPISVTVNFGDSVVQKKKIEDGESADIFLTSQAEMLQELKNKGMLDVYSIGPVAARADKNYFVAVVAGENMTPARVFLDYLKSPEARALFKKNGYTTPEG